MPSLKGNKNPRFSHGLAGSRFTNTFKGIRARTTDLKHKNYGAKGIRCHWKTTLDFKNDMYESYLAHVAEHGEKNTQIDRIDVNGDYCKENCRWATLQEQARNRGNNVKITIDGITKILPEWLEIYDLKRVTYKARIRRGYSPEEAVKRPNNGNWENRKVKK